MLSKINLIVGLWNTLIKIKEKIGVKGIIQGIFIICFILGFGYMFYHQFNLENKLEDKIETTITNIENKKVEDHKKGFTNSIEKYYSIKNVLKEYRKLINCEYILFLEYHNGAENIATGYQFCKFDITLAVCSDTVPTIRVENYKDESIFSYDIFANESVAHQRLTMLTLNEIKEIDKHFYNQLMAATSMEIGKVCTSHIKFHGYPAGGLIFIFSNTHQNDINKIEIANCASKIEEMLKS